MDSDEKVAFLIDLFPDEGIEFILNEFLINSGDIEQTINKILSNRSNNDNEDYYNLDDDIKSYNKTNTNQFDYLVEKFPEIEIEAIEAFLLARDENSGELNDDFEGLKNEFIQSKMVTQTNAKKCRKKDNNMKINLADFKKLLTNSNSRDFEIINNSKNCAHDLSDSIQSTFDNGNFFFTCKQISHCIFHLYIIYIYNIVFFVFSMYIYIHKYLL